MVDDTLPTEPWDRNRIRLEVQQLYQNSQDEGAKLKCLQMMLDLMPPSEPPHPTRPQTGDVAQNARRAIRERREARA